jgi:tetratricopeptide (TPR) repeat protein
MPGVTAKVDGDFDEQEIRAALEHMAASEAFRGSPQLVSFLRYVVEERLRGAHDRIKGYTIAVEALGRGDDFDPQTDPIVRVEATRLRRALNRYYENGGKHDPVAIELPLGSYVPMFRRLPLQPPPVVAELPPLATAASPETPLPATLRRLDQWRRIAAGLALVIAGAAVHAGYTHFGAVRQSVSPAGMALASLGDPRPMSPYPLVYVGPFQADADSAAQPAADRLRARLRDALGRFDEIQVMSGSAPNNERMRLAAADPSIPGYYTLSARISAAGAAGAAVNLNVLLTDIADGRVVYTRNFRINRGAADRDLVDEDIVREIAVTLAQPYGVIHARERAEQLTAPSADPRYRCLLDYYDYFRTFDPAAHVRVRDCLEREIAADPTFAAGHSALAEIILQEHRRQLNVRPGDGPPLDRALAAARRAVEIKPGSAHGHQALMDVLFLRGDHALALEAGEKALSLNPYNPNTLACYGARLIALGHLEKGARLMREAAAASSVRPAWHDFFLFLAAYLSGDPSLAASHAAQISSPTFTLGLLARTLVAVQQGKLEIARQRYDRLTDLHPGWRDIAREARKVFPAETVHNRVVADLAKASGGLGQ